VEAAKLRGFWAAAKENWSAEENGVSVKNGSVSLKKNCEHSI
jgi:hypothetical protein